MISYSWVKERANNKEDKKEWIMLENKLINIYKWEMEMALL